MEPRDVLDYGVIPELAGRIPVIVTLDTLTQVQNPYTRHSHPFFVSFLLPTLVILQFVKRKSSEEEIIEICSRGNPLTHPSHTPHVHTPLQDDLVEIACNKERGVVAQITDLLQLDNCELIFTDEAIRAVAELAFCKQIGEY